MYGFGLVDWCDGWFDGRIAPGRTADVFCEQLRAAAIRSQQREELLSSHRLFGASCLDPRDDWNLRLELGHQHHPDPVRTTEFAPTLPAPSPHAPPASGYTSPHVGLSWKVGRFSGQDVALQPYGTLRCSADQKLYPHEQRREADGSLRVVYGASITGLDILLVVARHAVEHLGQAELTRDLVLASTPR